MSGDESDHDAAASAAPDDPRGLFHQLWISLGDILGNAATATLLRRSLKRAATRAPALAGVEITRERFEYRYTLSPAWKKADDASMNGLRALVEELCPLLIELTGPVVLARLRQNPALRLAKLFPEESQR